MRLLFKVLKNEEHAQVKVPDVEDTAAYKAVIEANFPDLSGVWCVMDWLKVPIQRAADEETQNAHCNGWLHGHYIGCVLAFVPSGLIVACTLNAPKSRHDTVIAENGGLYEMLKTVHNTTKGKAVVELVPMSYQIGKTEAARNGIDDSNLQTGNIPSSISRVGNESITG
jgi:hypothetical protein